MITSNRFKENHHIVKVLPIHVQDMLLEKSNKRYKALFTLMLDCGLRVTEATTLKVENFDFFKKQVTVKSLKKRGKQLYRTIPMSDRTVQAVADLWDTLKKKQPGDYIFPSKTARTGHLGRVSVWRYMKKITDGYANPHMCRHTFGSDAVNSGTDIRVVQDLLGHASQLTTEIYLHVPEEEKRKAIKRMNVTPWYMKAYRKVVPQKHIILTPAKAGMTNFHVGRVNELKKLSELMGKKINTYIQGDMGTGKTHLLDSIDGAHYKLLRMDEFSGKKALAGLLIAIIETDKRGIAEMLFKVTLDDEPAERLPDTKDIIKNALNRGKSDLSKVVMKESIKRLAELLIEITKKDEYTIIIDDATNITPAGVRNLEKLRNHFHIVLAARNIKLDKGTFLSNFEKIELKPLDRAEAIQLINIASKDIYTRIEDYEGYKNHIWEQTVGNPLYILESIDRYSREANISREVVKDIKHTAALKEINMALPLIIMISGLMVLRYYGREAGDDSGAFMLFGGIFMIFALFARPLANLGKRKWV